ncbi:MAG TPA: hypothetical protein PK351_09680 [Spirochaetota bacterium]|nr:hypothetical protein [Spirochaetota bacterium]
MKRNIAILFIILVALLNIGCPLQKYEITVFSPVYMGIDKIRESVVPNSTDIPDFNSLGKFILYNNYIFINKMNKGIFVIDNTNKTSPQIIKFISIPGNIDLAIKDDILYADSYVDLIAFYISDINNISIAKRLENVFPREDMQPFLGKDIDFSNPDFKYEIKQVDKTKGIVVDWEETKEIRAIDPLKYFSSLSPYTSNPVYYESTETEGGGTSIGGSMARFTLYDNYLYAVYNSVLYVFDISTTSNPSLSGKFGVAWNIETIFCYNKNIFIGGQDGVYIYDVSNDPVKPEYLSRLVHVRTYDPVVVANGYAYSTLRGNLNQLDIIDIRDIKQPQLVTTYPMTEPYGLGITSLSDKNYLFICDGKEGVKIYDAPNPFYLILKKVILKGEKSYDVILYNNTAYIVTSTSFYQYDYSNIDNITQLSKITIKK